tara:strand:+ start:105 stop:788 length:684 start_codon:yes stop_codon:yes gene_type:complete
MSAQKYIRTVRNAQTCLCGEDRGILLEFAHNDRNEKIERDGKKLDMSSIRSKCIAENELKKGRFLCVFCHREETMTENRLISENSIESLVISCSKNYTETGIECRGNICRKRLQNASLFKNSKSKCANCISIEKMYKRKIKQKYMQDQKVKYGKCSFCKMECKHSNSHLFDWDHVFGKNINVSKLITYSKNIISNEIKLCRLLCAKCHRIKTTMELRGQWTDVCGGY